MPLLHSGLILRRVLTVLEVRARGQGHRGGQNSISGSRLLLRALEGPWRCLYEPQAQSGCLDGEVQGREAQGCVTQGKCLNCSVLHFFYWKMGRRICRSYTVVEKLNFDKPPTVPGVVSGMRSHTSAGFAAFMNSVDREVLSPQTWDEVHSRHSARPCLHHCVLTHEPWQVMRPVSKVD